MGAADKYIRGETIVSVIVTIAASLAAYLLVFEIFAPVPTLGVGAYAFDFGPQAFMTALFCTWVPGLITRKRVGRGAVGTIPGASPRIESLWLRGLAYAGAALLVAAVPVVLAIVASGATHLPWSVGLAGKIVFGGAVAAIVTPVGLRAVLRSATPAR